MSNEKILAKIKKCLALSKSENGNEAATALRHAQALMEKHNINQSTVELSDITSKLTSASKSQNPPRYNHILVSTIAKAFAVKPIYHPLWDETKIEFIGFDAQPEIAAYCYDVLHRQLTKDRKAYMDTLSKRYKKANKTRKADLFAESWVMGAYRKITEFALTEKQKSLIEEYLEQRHDGKLKTLKPRTHKIKKEDDSAMHKGYLAGKNADLNRGMGADQRERLTHG